MQRPTAAPRIPASASGVAKQRSGPKRSRSPAVARKTPPARLTSSPITSTDGSRPSSTCNASLTASTMLRSATDDPPQLVEIGTERCGRIDVRVYEQKLGVGSRLGLRRRDPRTHRVGRLGADRLCQFVGQDPRTPQVALATPHALAPLLF